MGEKNKNPLNGGSENISLGNMELFDDLFGKSIIATLFYDKECRLISANQSALNVFRVSDLGSIYYSNLFDFPWIDLDHKNKLEREGFVEFQSVINIGFIKKELLKSESEEVIYTIWTIKRLNSGYLVQIQDITGQKQAENRLHESEKRYGELFNNPLNAFVILETVTDKNGKPVDFILLEANTTFEKLTGFKVEEVIYKRITEFAPEAEVKDIIRMFANVALTGKPFHFEQYFSQMDKYLDIAVFLSRKRQLTVFFADITNRKLVEEKLQNTLKHLEIEKKQLSAIIENIPVGVIIAEAPSGKFLLANKQIADIWRYPQTASADEFKKYKGFHHDGRPYKTYEWPLSRSIRTGEVVKDEEIEILRGDGTRGVISVSSVPARDDEGNIIMGVVIDLDITERKQADDELKRSKKRLETIIQGSPVLTFIIDKNHKVIHWNNAIEEYSGIKAGEVVGTENHWKALYSEKRPTMADLLIEEDFKRIHELYSGKCKRSKVVEGAYEIEDFFSTMGKKGRWLRATVTSIKDFEGNIIGAMEILEDITERKEVEEKLKEARDNLEKQVKERTAELEEAYGAVKESEEKFRLIFDKATDMISLNLMEKGMPGLFIEVNEVGIKRLGYSREEFLNMTPCDIDKGPETPKNVAKLLEKGHLIFESIHVTKDGREIPVEINSHFIEYKGKKVGFAISRDISDRKKAEKALKESEEKFRELFNKATDSIVLSEVKENGMPGRFIEVNEVASRVLGYNENEWGNMTPADLFAPEERAILPQIAAELQKKGYARFESVSITKDRRKFPVEVNVHVFRLRGKNVGLAITRDISERKQAEDALKESEEKFREIFNNANDVITLSEVKENGMPGRFIEVNEVAYKMLGYSKEELLNITPFDIVDPDAPVSVSDIASEMSKKGYARHESILVAKDGSKIPVEVATRFFKLRGQNVILAFSRDITERKKAEEALKESEGKFRALYDDNPSMYFTIDEEFTVLSVNSFGAELIGYTVPELIGQPLSMVFHEEDREFAAQNLKYTLENHGQVFHWELRKVRKDGSVLWVKETARAVKESEGNVVIYTVCEDITDRKEAEEALKESEKKFRELFNQATDMITLSELGDDGTISHYIEINEAASNRLGYSKNELLNMTALDIYLDQSAIMDVIYGLLEKGYSIAENIQVAKDGMQIPVELNTHLFKLKGKNVVLSISRDITERKRAEEELRRSETILEEASSLSKMGAYEWDMEKDEFILSKEWQRIHGVKVNRLSSNDLMRMAHPDDIPKVQKALNDALDGIRPYDVEHRIINQSNGEIRYIHARGRILRDKNGKPTRMYGMVRDKEGKPTKMYGVAEDITERKKAEEQIKRLVDIINSSDDAVIGEDLNGIIFSWNKGAEKMYGYSALEVIGEHMSILMTPSEWERISKFREEIKKGKDVAHYEAQRIRKDGTNVDISVTLSPVRNVAGEITGVSVIARDVTERKKAEKALRESEEKFRLIFDKSTDMITLNIVNEDNTPGRFIEVNEVGIKRLGYNKEEFLNLTPYDIDKEHETPKNVEILMKRGHFTFESAHLAKDRRKIPVEINIHIIEYKGMRVGLSISRDITERKKAERALRESEEKLNATIESSPDSITVTDLNLNIVSCNQATVTMYGAFSKDEIIGLNAFELVDPLDQPMLAETMKRILSENRSVTLEINLITRKDNKFFPAEVSGNVIRDAEGKPVAFVAITKDITERKNAEKERETLINELKRSNEELQQFAYVASHDLQEPLRTIASFTQLLARRYKGQIDKDADEFIEFIVDGTNRMQAMIKDLLQYSRVQTKGEEFKSTDVQNALNQALSNLKVSIEENNAEITHDELPTVIADEKQLIQLFQNLISNAIKFKKPDVPPKIHISAKKDEEKGEYIFGVSDNGIGMEPQYLERIFELFQRLHTRDEYKGTGIGLAVAKKIVDRHGGRVWVESEPGKGSTFYFTIFIKEESE